MQTIRFDQNQLALLQLALQELPEKARIAMFNHINNELAEAQNAVKKEKTEARS